MTKNFILASGSSQRIALLSQIGYEPKKIQPADIDESIHKFEKPTTYVKRMALQKAKCIAEQNPGEVVLGGDTIVVIGATILQKAHTPEEQEKYMHLLSGKTNRVMSAVCVIDQNGKVALRCVTSKVYVKKMTQGEIKNFVAKKDWVGCSGWKIEGEMAAYVKKIVGSYTGIIGLPLFETKNLLNGVGIK